MYTQQYHELVGHTRAHHEDNDCAPRAMTVVTDHRYEIIRYLLGVTGRKAKKGTPTVLSKKVLKQLGYKYKTLKVTQKTNTVRKFEESLEGGDPGRRFLVRIRKHILGVRGNTVHDWSRGKRCKVLEIIEVFPPEETAETPTFERWDFFMRREAANFDKELSPVVPYIFWFPVGLSVEEALESAYEHGLRRGSHRSGCFEIQGPGGIWSHRTGARIDFSTARKAANVEFTSWDDPNPEESKERRVTLLSDQKTLQDCTPTTDDK